MVPHARFWGNAGLGFGVRRNSQALAVPFFATVVAPPKRLEAPPVLTTVAQRSYRLAGLRALLGWHIAHRAVDVHCGLSSPSAATSQVFQIQVYEQALCPPCGHSANLENEGVRRLCGGGRPETSKTYGDGGTPPPAATCDFPKAVRRQGAVKAQCFPNQRVQTWPQRRGCGEVKKKCRDFTVLVRRTNSRQRKARLGTNSKGSLCPPEPAHNTMHLSNPLISFALLSESWRALSTSRYTFGQFRSRYRSTSDQY